MSKIEIELPPVLKDFLENQVETGLYKSVGDAIEDAIRRAYEDDGFRIEAVRSALAQGVAEADAGEYFEGTIDDIIARRGQRAPSANDHIQVHASGEAAPDRHLELLCGPLGRTPCGQVCSSDQSCG